MIEGVVAAVSFVGGAGGAWAATRTRVTRAEKDIEGLQADVKAHAASDVAQHASIIEKLAKVEAGVDLLVKRFTE